MNAPFADAMRRATDRVRSGDPLDATRIIQTALAGAAAPRGDAPYTGHTLPTLPAPDDARGNSTRASAGPAPRRSLRAVIAALRKGRDRLPSAFRRGPAAEPEIAPGARFLARTHADAAGSRDYRLYVPAALGDAAPEGIVLMLHGCKQTPEDFAVGTRMHAQAEARRLIVAWPAQTGAHNASRCWNWFRPEDQTAGAGEPAILAGLARALVAEFGAAPDRVFVAGLSAGGAMAAVLGATHPDLFAAVGVHSGLPAGCARDVVSAFAAMRGETGTRPQRPAVRTIVLHGTADGVVVPSNAERILPPAADARLDAGPGWTRRVTPDGELWRIDGLGHAWSGGDPRGSFAAAAGPDASAEMIRFFLEGSPR